MNRTAVVAVVVTATALVTGVLLFLAVRQQEPTDIPSPVAGRDPVVSPDLDRLQDENRHLQQRIDDLRDENARLRQRADHPLAVPDQVPLPEEPEAAAPTRRREGRRLDIEFGPPELADALDRVDLSRVSKTTQALTKMMTALAGAEGGDAQGEAWKQISEDYKRARLDLEVVGHSLRDRVPTSIEGGESTHPLVLANVISETLDDQGVPLDEEQVSQIELLGQDYQAAWQREQAGYRADTIHLERILDELELRRTFSAALDALLAADQLEALGPEEMRHVAHLDFHSVSVALGAVSYPLLYGSPESLRADLDKVARTWGLEDEHLGAVAFALDRWAAAPLLTEPVTPGESKFFPLDVAIEAGRAQQQAMETVARVLAYDGEIVATVRAMQRFAVPRYTPGWGGNEK